MVQEDITEASVVFGVKQVPIDSLRSNKTFCFFSHTIKVHRDTETDLAVGVANAATLCHVAATFQLAMAG